MRPFEYRRAEDPGRAVADAELAEARPPAHNAFKIPMARNTFVAVLRDLLRGEGAPR